MVGGDGASTQWGGLLSRYRTGAVQNNWL